LRTASDLIRAPDHERNVYLLRVREAYFERRGDVVVGRPHAASVWAPNMLGGRQLSGLVAWVAERDHGDAAFIPSRLTVDMFRPAPLGPLTVKSELIREGGRIRVCDVFISSDEKLICRGNVVFLRSSEDPPGTVWEPTPWDVPHPDDLSSESDWPRSAGDVRVLSTWDGREQRRLWFRETGELVEGVAVTPFVRVATVADIANPMGNMSERGLGYINADLTVNLARLPVGEWIGCETSFHTHDAGVAVGGIALYDTTGRLGWAMVAALADLRAIEAMRAVEQPPPVDDSAPGVG
jgi:acyl-CoA thioesterase